MRPLLHLLAAVPLLAACSQQAAAPVQQAPLAMPSMIDVLPSNISDRSCTCELRGQCAMVADAIAGGFEGRNLQCRVEDESRRLVRCRFESRFVEGIPPDPLRPGPWQWQESIFHNHAPGAWCAGTPS